MSYFLLDLIRWIKLYKKIPFENTARKGLNLNGGEIRLRQRYGGTRGDSTRSEYASTSDEVPEREARRQHAKKSPAPRQQERIKVK